MYGIALILFGDRHDLLWHSCGEEHGLSVLGNIGKYGFNILAEAHIQHLVSLVKDDSADIFEFEGPPADVVHNTTGSTYNYISAAFQLMYLFFHACAAVDSGGPDALLELGEFAYFLISLHGKLTGGAEYEYHRRLPVGVGYALNSRDTESSGLARTCV